MLRQEYHYCREFERLLNKCMFDKLVSDTFPRGITTRITLRVGSYKDYPWQPSQPAADPREGETHLHPHAEVDTTIPYFFTMHLLFLLPHCSSSSVRTEFLDHYPQRTGRQHPSRAPLRVLAAFSFQYSRNLTRDNPVNLLTGMELVVPASGQFCAKSNIQTQLTT